MTGARVAAAGRPALERPPARIVLAAAAVGSGAAAAWLAGGGAGAGLLAAAAVPLAVANGYGKAYSP